MNCHRRGANDLRLPVLCRLPGSTQATMTMPNMGKASCLLIVRAYLTRASGVHPVPVYGNGAECFSRSSRVSPMAGKSNGT